MVTTDDDDNRQVVADNRKVICVLFCFFISLFIFLTIENIVRHSVQKKGKKAFVY